MRKILAFIVCLLLIILLRAFVFSIWRIPGNVMYPLINRNQKVLVLRNWWFEPKRGDVVIVRAEVGRLFYVRRIIAVGGDTLTIRKNELMVNGRMLAEPYKQVDWNGDACSYPDTVSLVVPFGDYFVMGDNRCARSDLDSRIHGTVSCDRIRGKVVLIFQPLIRR